MAHAWKACWVNALGGSNPPSSADSSLDRILVQARQPEPCGPLLVTRPIRSDVRIPPCCWAGGSRSWPRSVPGSGPRSRLRVCRAAAKGKPAGDLARCCTSRSISSARRWTCSASSSRHRPAVVALVHGAGCGGVERRGDRTGSVRRSTAGHWSQHHEGRRRDGIVARRPRLTTSGRPAERAADHPGGSAHTCRRSRRPALDPGTPTWQRSG